MTIVEEFGDEDENEIPGWVNDLYLNVSRPRSSRVAAATNNTRPRTTERRRPRVDIEQGSPAAVPFPRSIFTSLQDEVSANSSPPQNKAPQNPPPEQAPKQPPPRAETNTTPVTVPCDTQVSSQEETCGPAQIPEIQHQVMSTSQAPLTPPSPQVPETYRYSKRMPDLPHGHRRMFMGSFLMDDDCVQLPEDIHTMVFLAPLHSIVFWYALFVFFLQVTILVLALLDMMKDDPGSEDRNRFNIPQTTTTAVALAQYIALLVAALSQDDVTHSLILISVGIGPEFPQARLDLKTRFPGAHAWKFVLSNAMRLGEGLFTVFVTVVLIAQSETVLDIFLNFAAMEFVSELDNLGWRLAKEGWLGHPLHQLARDMEGEVLPARHGRGRMYYFNRTVLFLITVGLLGCAAAATFFQGQGRFIETNHCSVLDVQFGDEVYALPRNATFNGTMKDGRLYFADSTRVVPVFFNLTKPPELHYSYFSGKYRADFSHRHGVQNLRPIYYELVKSSNIEDIDDEDASLGMFYYCLTEHAWVWTVVTLLKSGVIPQQTIDRCQYGWLLRSPITEALVLEDVPTEEWRVWTGVLHATDEMSFRCLECRTDIDCGLERGICGTDNVCHCQDYADGYFCNENKACNDLVSIFADGAGHAVEASTYSSREGLDTYGRPMYFRPWDIQVARDARFADNYTHWELLFYSGRRWISYRGARTEFDLIGNDFDAHAYWLGLQDLPSSFWFTEPTTSFLPTGPLKWYRLDETRSEGNYGAFGREIKLEYRLECLSVDCASSSRVCGRYGTCTEDRILAMGKQPAVNFFTKDMVVGGKCVCDPGYYGHFCEFTQHEEDSVADEIIEDLIENATTSENGTTFVGTENTFDNSTKGDEEL